MDELWHFTAAAVGSVFFNTAFCIWLQMIFFYLVTRMPIRIYKRRIIIVSAVLSLILALCHVFDKRWTLYYTVEYQILWIVCVFAFGEDVIVCFFKTTARVRPVGKQTCFTISEHMLVDYHTFRKHMQLALQMPCVQVDANEMNHPLGLSHWYLLEELLVQHPTVEALICSERLWGRHSEYNEDDVTAGLEFAVFGLSNVISNAVRLRQLWLNITGLSSNQMWRLFSAIEASKSLHKVTIITDGFIPNTAVQAIRTAFAQHPTIRHVTVEFVWPYQSINILPALVTSKTLTHLTFLHMRYRYDTLLNLFDGLTDNTTLTDLSFCHVFHADVPASDRFQTDLLTALRGNTTLQRLTLLRCGLYDLVSDEIRLPVFVRKNPSLRSLNIMGNHYCDNCLRTIISEFVDKPSTEELRISVCRDRGHTAHEVLELINARIACRLGRFRKSIWVDVNGITIYEALEQQYYKYCRLVEENDRVANRIVDECALLQLMLQKSVVRLPEHVWPDFALFCKDYLNF